MYAGYADVAMYTQCTDDGRGVVPMLDLFPARAFDLLPKPTSVEHCNPWISGATFEDDFIFVAEFSEIEGPKPLMTVPYDGGGTFDQNAFAIRILSADYHNSVSTEFRPVRDTQVVLSQVQEGAVAYVHYFTLYDIRARGFVRPFCVSYVTADKTKITKNFEELRNAFLEVLKHFKYRNLRLFTNDLENRVKGTRDVDDDDNVDSFGSYSDSFTNGSSCRSFDLKLRTLEELCDWNGHEGVELLRLIHRHFSRDSLVLMLEKMHLFLLKPTAGLLTFGGCMALNVLGGVSDVLNKDQSTLCCKSDAGGRRYSIDSSGSSTDESDIEVLMDNGQYSSPTNLEYVTARIQHLIKDLSEQNSKCHTTPNSDYGHNDSLPSQGGALGNGDLPSVSRVPTRLPEESFESGDSFRICTPNSSWWNTGMECFYRNTANISPVSFQQDATSLSSSVDSSRQESVCDPQSPSLRFSQTGGTIASKYWHLNADAANEFDMKCDRYTQLVLCGSMGKTLACKLHRTYCIAVANFTDQCFRLTKATPGYGIRHFLNHFSFTVHMIYCLLSGRPLLVVGPETMEAEVRATVLTLSMFVPGNNISKSVIPWYTRKLKLGDLGYFRLVGLCVNDEDGVDSRMSATVRQYVSVFHYRNRTLKTPRYSGKMLSCLNEKRSFKTDGALITFLQTLLCELSLKAFLYFHTFCAQLSTTNKLDLATQPDRKTVAAFLNKTGVSGSDVDIVQYLGEVVKLQLKDEHFSTLNLREDNNQLPDMTISSRRGSRERCSVS